MQGLAIREAKELGLFVIAVDGNKNAVCVNEADIFAEIDLKDVGTLVEFAKKTQNEKGLDAVFTTATDFSYSVACIAKACGLKSHSVVACEKSTNKFLMRNAFLKAGLNSPKFFKVTSSDMVPLKKMMEKKCIKFPVVIKPVDSMGARGCKKVNSLLEAQKAVDQALQYSKTKTVIIEQFIKGKEFSIEGFVVGKDFFVTAIADRHIYFPPYFIEMGHSIPSNLSEQNIKKLCDTFEKGVRALGLDYGVCKGDVFLSNGKPYIGEIAARLSGGFMSGWTVPYSSNINVTKLAIELALGESEKVISTLKKENLPPSKQNTKKFSAERAWISIPGKVEEIIGLQKAKKSKGVQNVFPRVQKGDEVKFPSNNVEKCGNVLATANDYKKACRRAEIATQKVLLRLQANNFKTEIFLQANFIKNFRSLKISNIIKTDLSDEKIKDLFHNYKKTPNFIKIKFKLLKKIIQKINSDTCEINFVKNVLSNKNLSKPKLVKAIIPKSFKPILKNNFDLQGRSVLKMIKQLFKIENDLFLWLSKNKNNPVWSKFWSAFLRGGIQGALYVYDSQA